MLPRCGMDERTDELRGWKEIAGYLGKSVRAAQRWETLYGLPVRRIAVPSRSAIVYARRSEIEAWKAGLDPRALQDEDEDEPDTAVDADADAGGNGNGYAFGNGRTERVPAGADDRPPVVGAGGGVAPGLPGLVEMRPSGAAGTEDHRAAATSTSARSRRLWPWLLTAGIAVAVAFAAVMWSRAGGADSSGAPQDAGPAAAAGWDRAGLDPGPWAVTGHDRRNSYQSHLLGPERPAEPRLLYLPLEQITNDGRVVATSNGSYLAGTCDGAVLAIDREGGPHVLFRLDRQSGREAASGFALVPGRLFVSTSDCPHNDAANARTQMTSVFLQSGHVEWRYRAGAQNVAPAVSAEGGWYQLDQSNTLRRMGATGAPKWVVDFPGFTHDTPAQDARDVLYVPTDGGPHGHRSLWAVSPEGRVLWSAGEEAFTQAAVGPDSNVYVYQATADVLGTRGQPDMLRSFDSQGRQRWAVEIRVTATCGSVRGLPSPMPATSS